VSGLISLKKPITRLKQLMIVALYGAAVSNVAAIDEVSYHLDIKPILDKKCIVCHACFDAPCQLVLTHATGLERGANRQPVYDGLRVSPAPPTRLHFDAKTVKQWCAKNFFSVLPGDRGNAVKLTISEPHNGSTVSSLDYSASIWAQVTSCHSQNTLERNSR
jgi:hypothetical protein